MENGDIVARKDSYKSTDEIVLLSNGLEKKITTIFATHDSSDVLSFADEVLVIKDGQLIEEGNPKSIYNYPKNKYIASLFGDVNEIELDGKIELGASIVSFKSYPS